jgi:hypothetical protein
LVEPFQATAATVRKRRKFVPKPASWTVYAGVILAMVLVKAGFLHLFDRDLVCPCGVKLWYNDSVGPENSQHIADWYSVSHFISGMVFAWVMVKTSPAWTLGWKLVAATAFSAGWEIAENTPLIVNAFQAVTIGEHYTGDTIINSMFDTLFLLAGFLVALRLAPLAAVLLALGLEILTTVVIGDGLVVGTLRLLGSLLPS